MYQINVFSHSITQPRHAVEWRRVYEALLRENEKGLEGLSDCGSSDKAMEPFGSIDTPHKQMSDAFMKYYGGEARECWKRLSDYTVRQCYGKGRVNQCITKLTCCII